MREGQGVEGRAGTPDANAALRDEKQVHQLAHQQFGQLAGLGVEHQRARPAVQLVGDADIVLPMADHLDDLAFEAADLVAQHLHLPLLQRHRPLAVRAGELHAAQQLGVALEEARRVGQVIGNVGLGDALDAG